MNYQTLRELKRNLKPGKVIYRNGLEYKVDHIDEEQIVTTCGNSFHHSECMNIFLVRDLGKTKVDAIKKDLLDHYNGGNDTLEHTIMILSGKYGLPESAITRISKDLTVQDFTKYYEELKQNK